MTKTKFGFNPRVRMLDVDRIKPGSDPSKAVDALYAYGRRYGEKPAEWPAAPAANPSVAEQHKPRSKHDVGNFQVNQAPEDFHGPGYDNQTTGHVRGTRRGTPSGNNETATSLPNFDHSADRPSMQPNKGTDWSKKR
jgi:hypothetical protein